MKKSSRSSRGRRTTGRGLSRAEGKQFAGLAGGDLDTSMFWFGDLNVWGSFPTVPTVYQKPRPTVFYMARNWFERQVFVKAITLLRQSICNYQFEIVPTKKSAEKAVAEWAQKNEVQIRTFTRDAWSEWLTMDNVISVWRPRLPRPLVFPIEHVAYNDDFGIEQLAFAHGMTPDLVNRLPGLSEAEKKMFMGGDNLTLTKQGDTYVEGGKVFRFEVLKRTRVGIGLAWPQLRTIFNTIGGWESLELADWQLADALRNVYELHKVGHEIKNGTHAGSPAHFLKKKRAEAIAKQIKNSKSMLARIVQLIVNFDHTIEYPRPDPKNFSSERYQGFLERLILWSMPLSQMLFMKQLNPYLMPFFKAQVTQERNDYMKPFLKSVFRQTMGMPAEADIRWGEDIFWDSRLMLDILKTGMAAGPLSQTTFLKKTGMNPEEERKFKNEENELEPHQVMPVYDPAHGNDPTAENGRPAGGKDKNRRKAKES